MSSAGPLAPVRRPAAALGAFLVFALVACVATWPWAARLGDAAPDVVDTYVNAWRLWWGAHALATDPAHLFDGNIFFPHRDALAFSETLLGVAVPVAPLFLLGLTPLAVNGAATILGLALSGWAAWRLARTLGAAPGGAWAAGLAFGFAPYHLAHLNHVGAIWAAGIPFALEALVLFARERTVRRALWLAAALAFLGTSWMTWLLLAATPLALSALALSFRGGRFRDARYWLLGAAALALALIALGPSIAAYRRVARTHGFVRSVEEATFFSGRPSNWLDVAANNRFWTALQPRQMSGERRLCPGVFLLALAAAGLVAGLGPKAPAGVRALAGLGALWAGVGFVGSLGMHAPLHRVLWEWVPGFQAMRVPLRWAMPALLGLALLAAAAVSAVRRSAIAGAAACALLLVEQRACPLVLADAAGRPSASARRLAALDVPGGIVELPARSPFLALYTLRAADHGRPLVTADSSFVPESSEVVRRLSAERPVPVALLDALEATPAGLVVFHRELADDEEREALGEFLERGRAAGRLARVEVAADGAEIWRVVPRAR